MGEQVQVKFQKIGKSILRTTKIVKWVTISFIGLSGSIPLPANRSFHVDKNSACEHLCSVSIFSK